MSAVDDLGLRRTVHGHDRGAIVDNVIDGAESLLALVSSWRMIALRPHVPVSGRRDD